MTRFQAILDAAQDQDDLVNHLVQLGVQHPAEFARLFATQITATDLRRAINGKPPQRPSVH